MTAAQQAGSAQDAAVAALRRVAFLLERALAVSYRSEAFRAAARTIEAQDPVAVAEQARAGTLVDLPGVGPRTAEVAGQVFRGEPAPYLDGLEADAATRRAPTGAAGRLHGALRGDLHAHTDESDGGTPAQEMVLAAVELGHDYLAITDHSPRLTVAHGLSAPRLRAQIDHLRALDRAVRPFRVLTGIEADILDDGDIDQEPALLDRLDVVVASVHSHLRMDSAAMTRRMRAAVRNPRVDVLGHCTGRQVTGRGRPPSEFDAAAVFAECADHGVAVEINCRPDRLDPPHALLELAARAGCLFTIDTDAHAPGQLDWQAVGCERAAEHGIDPERVLNTWDADRLLAHLEARKVARG